MNLLLIKPSRSVLVFEVFFTIEELDTYYATILISIVNEINKSNDITIT